MYPTQITVADAIKHLQEKARPLETESLPLLETFGRILAEDLGSLVDHPSLDNSAMDGFACKLEDTLSATEGNPVRLELIGEIPAGSWFESEVMNGQSVSIYTGAPMPAGTDAVVPVELSKQEGSHVLVYKPADPAHVRPRGQDFRAGEPLLQKGLRLSAASVGLAASMGHKTLKVSKKARVGILSTGDEVIEPGETILAGQVYNSNTYSIAGLVRAAGADAIVLPNVRDDINLLTKALESVGELDLILTTGGVSMGRYDFVRDLLFDDGEVYFWKVAMKPAGPALFGSWREIPVLGLPGNPVSCMVAFLILAKAFLQALSAESTPLPYFERLEAIAGDTIKGAGVKENFARVSLQKQNGMLLAKTTGNQSSGVLRSMLLADGLAVVPPQTTYQKGDVLEVIRLFDYLR